MQYIIMLTIVVGLAAADFVTGFIKAYAAGDINSRKMRTGGLGKAAEIVVMGSAIGLNIGFEQLGRYYNSPELTELAGMVTALGVFIYIAMMEIISILENFAELSPDAGWLRGLITRLKIRSKQSAKQNNGAK
ncbi:MAG: phage holin family protein [Ruminococcus sp.]|nr:phage holin family protein [Ruminococcus sp.]